LFEAQQRNAGTALNANDIGLNANILVVAGSTVTGYSASVVDTTGPATTNTLDVKIMGIVDDPVNDIGAPLLPEPPRAASWFASTVTSTPTRSREYNRWPLSTPAIRRNSFGPA
jgi:hypothetical protein